MWDGDNEYAEGGAYLVTSDGDGLTWGGLVCYQTEGHHPIGGRVTVFDAAEQLGDLEIFFSVAADHSRVPPSSGSPDCGDGVIEACDPPPSPSPVPAPLNVVIDTINYLIYQMNSSTCNALDHLKDCLNSCHADLPPGIDGAYHVLVRPLAFDGNGGATTATRGHIEL